MEVLCSLQGHSSAPVRGSCAMLSARTGGGQPETHLRSFGVTSPADHITSHRPPRHTRLAMVCKSNQGCPTWGDRFIVAGVGREATFTFSPHLRDFILSLLDARPTISYSSSSFLVCNCSVRSLQATVILKHRCLSLNEAPASPFRVALCSVELFDSVYPAAHTTCDHEAPKFR